MRDKINQAAALFFIYLMLIGPFSLAVDELPQDGSSPQDQEFQYENAFNNDPTPENFNNLPNPTAADLAKVSDPTLENFNHLPPQQQGIYLANENLYKQEFAERYYADSANWGMNAQADTVFFKQQTGLRDFLQKGAAEKNAAQQYFIKTFNAPYKFDQIAGDFSFDQEKGMLKNGLTNLVLAEFKGDRSITGITSTAGGFEISRKIEEKEQKVSVAGAEAKTVSYDREKGSFTFQLPHGQQRFEIPADAQVTFTFDAGKVTVDGPASGLVNAKGDYAQFINHDGKLTISYDGDLDAENAEVITSRLYTDGRYSKKGNKIQAWDVGLGGKQTVVVDKDACPEAGACIGVSTQGQWDARYLADKDKSKASVLKINLDEVSSASSFYFDPAKPQPTEEKKAELLREQARQLRKPLQPPLAGKNAEVWINKDADSKAITVTSKGVVAVGLYDARGNSAKPLKDTFSYRGLNGLSELDAQFSARTQANVRGQAEFKNDQFREGIATNQDGAVIKVTHDDFRPDQADVLRADCFGCASGEAIVIQKSINLAQETGVQGVFAAADRGRVRLTVEVDENGKIRFEPNRQDLGFLSQQILQEGQEVSIGNNLLVSVPCGGLECNFKLSRDPRTAELGAAYEFVDPKNPEAAVKRIEYPLSMGKALGSEAVLVSEANAAEVNRLTALVEEGKFSELSRLSFDKDDPGYAALKKKFLLESGLNLDAISDQKYARDFQTIIETTKKAKEAYKKYEIELDALGNFKTREDAEKYQKIVNKGLGADVDELTKARWDLSRMRVKEVEGLLAACQGTSYCSVSEKDLKAAKEEENKILKTRTANYNRWKVLVAKAELDRLKREADERAKREDKGIDATDKKELEDTKLKIDHGERRKVGLSHTLGVQKGRVNGYRSEIKAKLEKEWLAGGGGGAVIKAIDWERYEADPEYVISLVNKHAPRDFFDNKLDPEVIYLRESFRADASSAVQTQQKVEQLNTDLKAFESQNQALIEKYRLEGKDDIAAEVALLAGKYQEVNTILSGPNLATQEGIKEVVRLGKDKDGNVVVLETIDVSVLAGQSVVSDEVAKDIAGRAVRQQRDETLDQVALLYNYGYGNEAGAMLQVIEADNPELAQKLKGADEVPEALLDSEVVKLKKARLAQTDYAKRALEQREKDLEQAAHQARLKKEAEDLGTGREVSRAWKGLNFDLTSTAGALGTVSGAGRLAEASFGFLTDSSEKAAADALGITEVREDLDKQAFEEQQRQIQQLHSLRGKLRAYEQKGLSPSQAFADARAGIDRGADGAILSSSDQLQISVGDEPAAVLLEFDLTRSIFSEADKKLMETMDPLERYALIDQRKQEYAAERRELEFSVLARDAEAAQRFNRGKLAGEAAAKYQEAVAACPDCAGAQIVKQNLNTLNQNVLGDIIGVYTGETIGKSIAGGLERTGFTYTRETEESFRDMAIASFDALSVFDIAEAAVGAPLVAFDLLQKINKVRKATDAVGTALDAYRFASKGSREVFAAAKAAERAADTAEAAVEARKAVDAAKAALDAEIKAGQQASKYQTIKRAVNTPLGKFDRDVAKARNIEIDNIAAQTQNLNQAQRELTAARASGDTLAEGQSLVKISDAQEAIVRSADNIDELDDLLRVSNLAGPNRGVVRKGWDATFGKAFGAGPGEEVLAAENDFRRAADDFAEASANARLVGDTPEAILSRARLDAAKESVEAAARKLDDAYLDRKVERSKNALKVKLQQAQVSGSGDEVYDAVGADGVWKLDDLASNPAVRIEPEGMGLRFEVPEEAPPQLRIEVEEGNQLLLRIDTSDVRAEAEVEDQLFEVLADSEYAAANDVKARRLEAVGEEIPESLVSDVVEPCSLAAAAIFGLAACRVPETAEVAIPEAPVSGVRAATSAVPLEAAPEGFYNDVEELLSDPAAAGLPVHAANPAFDNQLINAHGSHAQYLQSYERITQENNVLQYLHQQFAAKGTPEPRLTNPGISTSSANKAGVVGFYENGGIFYRQFKDDDEVFAHAQEFFGYKGNDLEEAKQLIAQRQIKTLAGHETYHHAFQTHLTPAQKEVWSNFIKRDPNFQNAAQGLRELGFSEDHIVEELFTFRMNAHAFAEPELSEFAFIASNDELNLLKEMGVLPLGYKRPTKATHLGEGVYELDGKRYFRGADGNWKQERKLWFNKEVDDNAIIQELYIEELNAFPEKELAGIPELPEEAGIGPEGVSTLVNGCAIAGGAIYGAACKVPEIAGVPEPRISGVREIPEEAYFPERVPATEQGLGTFKEGSEGFVSNNIAAQRAYDSLENGEVLRITTKEGIDQMALVTIEGNKKYLTTVDISSGATTKTELIPTISSMTSLDQTAIEKLVVEDWVSAGTAGAVSIKRTGVKVDPSKVTDNLREVVGRGETVPLGSSFAAKKDDNVFTLGGKEYIYSADEGWTTKGILGFGKKQVTNPQDLAHLEAARLNVPLTEFGAPRQRFYFSEYVDPEWETGAINVLEAYRHDGGLLVRSEANFYIIDEAGDIYSVRGKFVGGATGSVPEGVDKDLIIGTLNTNPQLKERFLNDVSKLEPTVIDDVSKGKLYLHEIANDKKVTILAAGPDFDDIGVNVHGSHQGFVDSYKALSGLGPEVKGIETNPILKELHQRFKKKGIEPPRLTHDQVSVRQSSALGAYEEIGEDIGGIRYQIFTDQKSVLDQAKAAHGYKGNDAEEAKRLLAQEQLKLLAGHETTHHAFAKLLDQPQRDAWVNYVKTTNDPGMRKAWNYLKSSPNYGRLDDVRLADEMLAFRYDYHIYGDATSNFKFPPSQQELDMLESIGLPTQRTVAVETKTGVFTLADQEYVYDAAKQVWTTRGTGVGPLRFGKEEITDPEIIARLDDARLNLPIEQIEEIGPADIIEVIDNVPKAPLEATFPLKYFDSADELLADPTNYDGLFIHGGSPDLDTKFINVHGTHQDYVDNYHELSQENEVLSHLHAQFAEKGVPEPILTSPLVAVDNSDNAFGGYQYLANVINYRLFQNDEEVLAAAQKYFYYKGSNLHEAKQLIAQEQLKLLAGHETFHHAYHRFLTLNQREAWAYLISKDPQFQKAAQALREIGYTEDDVVEELFTFRMDAHTFGQPELPEFSFVAGEEELDMLKNFEVLPPDFIGKNAPASAPSTIESPVAQEPLAATG